MVAVRLFSDLFQAKEKDRHVTASPSLWPGVVRKIMRISKEFPCKEGTFPGHSTVDHDRERSGRANLRRHVDRARQAGRPGGISLALGSPSRGGDGRGLAALPSARPGRGYHPGGVPAGVARSAAFPGGAALSPVADAYSLSPCPGCDGAPACLF